MPSLLSMCETLAAQAGISTSQALDFFGLLITSNPANFLDRMQENLARHPIPSGEPASHAAALLQPGE